MGEHRKVSNDVPINKFVVFSIFSATMKAYLVMTLIHPLMFGLQCFVRWSVGVRKDGIQSSLEL